MSHYNGQKSNGGGQNNGQGVFGHFCEEADKTSGQNIRNPKNTLQKSFFLSELQEFDVWIRVQPNFPIAILSMLTGFHKFAKSMGSNTRVGRRVFLALKWNCLIYKEDISLPGTPVSPAILTSAPTVPGKRFSPDPSKCFEVQNSWLCFYLIISPLFLRIFTIKLLINQQCASHPGQVAGQTEKTEHDFQRKQVICAKTKTSKCNGRTKDK